MRIQAVVFVDYCHYARYQPFVLNLWSPLLGINQRKNIFCVGMGLSRPGSVVASSLMYAYERVVGLDTTIQPLSFTSIAELQESMLQCDLNTTSFTTGLRITRSPEVYLSDKLVRNSTVHEPFSSPCSALI